MPTATGALWKQMALLGKHTLCNFLFVHSYMDLKLWALANVSLAEMLSRVHLLKNS